MRIPFLVWEVLVSNSYVRRQVLSSIAYQISQKEEIIREYSYQLQQLQDELKKILQEVPVELHRILLYSEMILSEIDYDNIVESFGVMFTEE